MLTTTHAPRELLIALPGVETDLYRIHQLVWNHVEGAVGRTARKPSFIYRIDGGMIRVRSRDFPARGTAATAFRPTAQVFVDLAAVWGAKHDQPVPQAHLVEWCTQKLADAGYQALSLSVLDHEMRTGVKQALDIRIPVARVKATVIVADSQASACAWDQGIGRGKRFGLGMLAH